MVLALRVGASVGVVGALVGVDAEGSRSVQAVAAGTDALEASPGILAGPWRGAKSLQQKCNRCHLIVRFVRSSTIDGRTYRGKLIQNAKKLIPESSGANFRT